MLASRVISGAMTSTVDLRSDVGMKSTGDDLEGSKRITFATFRAALTCLSTGIFYLYCHVSSGQCNAVRFCSIYQLDVTFVWTEGFVEARELRLVVNDMCRCTAIN